MQIKDLEIVQADVSVGQAQPTWKKNDRTAGSIPVWGEAKVPNFADVLNYQENGGDQKEISFDSKEAFGFADMVDMINPLQHIPLVNLAYREITGDEIKPIGKIMGGGLFGGPAGAAGGVVDAIITQETGRDAAGNAFALVKNEETISQVKPDFSLTLLDEAPKNPKTVSAAAAYERMQFADNRTAGTIARYA